VSLLKKGGSEVPSKKTSVLVVDDDVYVVRMMQRILDLEGYRVLKVSSGEAAIDMFLEENPDLVLLDIMMPTMDGYAVCHHLREFSEVPIIIVTAKGHEDEKIKGLDAGADDYLTKPFSSAELAARVRAVLRRSVFRTEHSEPVFSSHDLTIDFAWHRVVLGGRVLDLTATEYRLLSYLVRNAGRVLTPDQILKEVWGEDYVGEHHLLRVNMARLRLKLHDDPRKPRFIVTKIGLGYMFLKPD
jgi:DNA-binding response OmpR family regulator